MKVYNWWSFWLGIMNFGLTGLNLWAAWIDWPWGIINIFVACFSGGVGIWSMRIAMMCPVAISTLRVPHRNAGTPPYPPNVPKSETIIPGEIIAWRAWIKDGLVLRSTFVGCSWKYNEPMYGIPGNGYGVHAFKTKTMAHECYCPGLYVIGQVALWGDVVEHTDGYRAEYAKVLSLDTKDSELKKLYERKELKWLTLENLSGESE